MFKTYILQSLKDGSYYYGHTEDIVKRLKQHNAGKTKYTKARRPWKIHYTEDFETKSQAFQRERFFKTIDGYNYLRQSGIIK